MRYLFLLTIFFCGCLSLFRDNDELVPITEPNGASVHYSNQHVVVPSEILLPRSMSSKLAVDDQGKRRFVEVEPEFSGWWLAASIVINASHGIFTLGISTVIGVVFDINNGVCNYHDPVNLQEKAEIKDEKWTSQK